ncbi:hypothetical protein NOF04DRAFT_4205 [Fusarium oxysporum II5]|uniref:Uncharacterized protein n=1 Tax=Fusarium odoratissimum (strain NRRL 54006) TaxID=1089451 RepID=X0J1D6_FUSO5|nr:uncharacterized protein FOIG_16663 [Fusarium odoratissimum NRRL 54006]EXL90065.1 hypothetical protein FOIG_16663 [Fusarium odoratissimum NRRL 54006]KAK2137998.1 hypothetical protein NOF04DRAFT_4205 [Fusarium oxysporum II5]
MLGSRSTRVVIVITVNLAINIVVLIFGLNLGCPVSSIWRYKRCRAKHDTHTSYGAAAICLSNLKTAEKGGYRVVAPIAYNIEHIIAFDGYVVEIIPQKRDRYEKSVSAECHRRSRLEKLWT